MDHKVEKLESETSFEPRRFRWRTLPVALIGGIGAIYLVAGVGSLLYMAITAWTGKPLYEPSPPVGFTRLGFMVAIVVIAMGSWLVLTAHQLWKWHWKTAILMIVACILANQMAIYFELLPE